MIDTNITTLIFDLDGVLVETREAHRDCLNRALKFYCMEPIPVEREAEFEGIPTKEKLVKYGVTEYFREPIYSQKQKYFREWMLTNIKYNNKLVELFKHLYDTGYNVAVASNAVRSTVTNALKSLGILNYVQIIMSAEDVENTKPHPEIYWTIMSGFGVLPLHTLIFEDSPVGIKSAQTSGANVQIVTSPDDLIVKLGGLFDYVFPIPSISTTKSNLRNIVIPMAGAGSRFVQAGYTKPKPLIEINGKPMIEVVLDSLGLEGQYNFIVQKEHITKWDIDVVLKSLVPDCRVIVSDGLTQGAAQSVLLAREYIDNITPLVIANSDQYIKWDHDFEIKMDNSFKPTGVILTFNSYLPKWSYAQISEVDGCVDEIAEKRVISNHATCGIYYWTKGSDYVKFADQMIAKDIRYKGEFYVAPVFNEAIECGRVILTKDVEEMWGLGDPESLEQFLKEHKE